MNDPSSSSSSTLDDADDANDKDDNSNSSIYQTRMYENVFPAADEFVMVRIKKVEDVVGAYVSLLEFGEKEGMVTLSELSRSAKRSALQLFRAGQLQVALVLQVDQERGYIDLSFKGVSAEEVEKAKNRWAQSKKIHSMMYHVARQNQVPLIELYQTFIWTMGPNVLETLKLLARNETPNSNLGALPLPIQHDLLRIIRHHFAPQFVNVRSTIDISCFTRDGIDSIKTALTIAKKLNPGVEIHYVAAPRYSVGFKCLDSELDKGEQLVDQVCHQIADQITQSGGAAEIHVGDEPKLDPCDSDSGSDSDMMYNMGCL